MKLRNCMAALGLMAAGWFTPARAYDYGWPAQYMFFQEHMDQVWKLWEDIGGSRQRDTQYALYDFDDDGKAELYLYAPYGGLRAILCCGDDQVQMVGHADYKNSLTTIDGTYYQYTSSVMGALYIYYSMLTDSCVEKQPFMTVQTSDDEEAVIKGVAGARYDENEASAFVERMALSLNNGQSEPLQINGTSPIALLAGLPLRKTIPDEVDRDNPTLLQVPSYWYVNRPGAVSAMNVQNAFSAIVRSLNTDALNHALQMVTTAGRPDYVKVINDPRSGYLQVKYEGQWDNIVECCYWNLPSGQKIVALYYHYFFESTEIDANGLNNVLWYLYDPQTKELTPMLEPPYNRFPDITRYELQLPRQGKDIRLMLHRDEVGVLHWNGSGFDLMMRD